MGLLALEKGPISQRPWRPLDFFNLVYLHHQFVNAITVLPLHWLVSDCQFSTIGSYIEDTKLVATTTAKAASFQRGIYNTKK